jgi:hypothetical protein
MDLTGTDFLRMDIKINVMPDNPNKKKADRKRVSQQPHEQAYQKRKAAKAGKSSSAKRRSS